MQSFHLPEFDPPDWDDDRQFEFDLFGNDDELSSCYSEPPVDRAQHFTPTWGDHTDGKSMIDPGTRRSGDAIDVIQTCSHGTPLFRHGRAWTVRALTTMMCRSRDATRLLRDVGCMFRDWVLSNSNQSRLLLMMVSLALNGLIVKVTPQIL